MVEQDRIEYFQTIRGSQGENGDSADTSNISGQTQYELDIQRAISASMTHSDDDGEDIQEVESESEYACSEEDEESDSEDE